MFVGHLESLFPKPVKGVHHKGVFVTGSCLDLVGRCAADSFITYIDTALKCREIDVYPVRVIRIIVKLGTVFCDRSVYRVFELIGIVWVPERLVFMFGEVDPVIPSWLGRKRTVARHQ